MRMNERKIMSPPVPTNADENAIPARSCFVSDAVVGRKRNVRLWAVGGAAGAYYAIDRKNAIPCIWARVSWATTRFKRQAPKFYPSYRKFWHRA